MTAVHAITHTALSVGGISSSRLSGIERFLLLLPALAEGTAFVARIGLQVRSGVVHLELCLEEGPAATARIRQRVGFWLAREGGSARAMEGMGSEELLRFQGALRTSELIVHDLSPAGWAGAIRRMFAAAGAVEPGGAPDEPELHLHLDGPGWQGFSFERGASLLEVPSPLAPPVGDALRLVLERAAGDRCEARARVIAVRPPARARAGSPAGFTVVLAEGSEDAARLLAARCPSRARGVDTRAAPRYEVLGLAPLTDPGEELRYGSGAAFQRDYLANLSHGGAFVRTRRPRRIGDRVDLHLRLPAGRALKVPATVVHRTDAGVGLQLELSPAVAEVLEAELAGLAARRRRVLVVDDDALARRLLTDAFEARGFDVRTASNGEEGLRVITDELLALDAVVTDVHMPGLAGDALVAAVRQAGGEAELVLVAVTADAAPELAERLRRAGADAVVSKGAGPDAAVAAVELALERHADPRVIHAPAPVAATRFSGEPGDIAVTH